MGKFFRHNRIICTVLTGMFLFLMTPNPAFAHVGGYSSSGTGFNMSMAYGVIALLSCVLMVVYALGKRKEKWLMLLFVAVFAVNTGYLLLSVSKTLEMALWANRLSYLGSCFLPLYMLMAIRKVCEYKDSKKFVYSLAAISLIMFAITASPGITDWYYAHTELTFINGMTKLEKVYGPLHNLYFVYLFAYFAIMVSSIVYVLKKKTAAVYQHANLLAVIVFLNIAIWFVEQLIYLDFEFLSVSYIISEMLLMLLYGLVYNMNEAINDRETVIIKDTDLIEQFMKNCSDVEELTSREKEILYAILIGNKRKKIAEDFNVSENTIKKHTSHIYQKLGVQSRDELEQKMIEFNKQC